MKTYRPTRLDHGSALNALHSHNTGLIRLSAQAIDALHKLAVAHAANKSVTRRTIRLARAAFYIERSRP